MPKTREETAELTRLDQIPQGMTEDETDAFWATHSLGDELLEQMEPFPDDFLLRPRAEDADWPCTEPERTGRMFPTGKILFGLAALGLAAVGYCALYRCLTALCRAAVARAAQYAGLRLRTRVR